MKMPKNVFVTVVVAAAVMSVIIVVAIQRGQPPETSTRTDNLVNGSYAVGEIVPLADCNIPADVLKPRHSYEGPDGIKTFVPRNYKPGLPFVEMRFLRRDLDGNLVPYEVERVGLSSLRGAGGSTRVGGMSGMRMAVTDDAVASYRNVKPGNDYRISHYQLEGQSLAIHTEPLMPAFHVPEDLPPNSVYRVNLVIKDEILEKELLARKEAAKTRRERIAEEEKITITLAEVPSRPLAILYHAGNRVREVTWADPNENGVEIRGPNKLGGELVACTTESGLRYWAYIRNLRRRDITLPKDADIICDEKDLVDLRIVLRDEDVAGQVEQQAIAFYASSEGKLPLFALRLRDKLADMPADTARELSVKIKPGTYYARMGEPMEKETAVGRVTVSAEGPNTWQLELPD